MPLPFIIGYINITHYSLNNDDNSNFEIVVAAVDVWLGKISKWRKQKNSSENFDH